jgi:hypothetical protein
MSPRVLSLSFVANLSLLHVHDKRNRKSPCSIYCEYKMIVTNNGCGADDVVCQMHMIVTGALEDLPRQLLDMIVVVHMTAPAMEATETMRACTMMPEACGIGAPPEPCHSFFCIQDACFMLLVVTCLEGPQRVYRPLLTGL